MFRKILNILTILRLFYWKALVAGIRSLLNEGDRTRVCEYWSQDVFDYFKIRLHELWFSRPLTTTPSIILSNHRSQGDFFVHHILVNHTCNVLARVLVGVVFFFFGIFGGRTVWFFNRNKKESPENFNAWLDSKFRQSACPSLLVYPEGHRMGDANSVSKEGIKTGMIKYAYMRNMPVQIMMAFGIENAFNQKKLHLQIGQKVVYALSPIYHPKEYKTIQQFVGVVTDAFVQHFDQVYGEYAKKVLIKQE